MTERDGLAIVGIDCLFPEANGVEAFWQNVLARHCSIQMLGERHLPEHLRSKVESRLSAVMPKLDVKSQQFRLPPTITRNFDVRVLQMLEIVRRLFAEHTNLKKESLLSLLCSQKMMPREQASTSLERRLQVMSFFEEMKAMQGLDAETADDIRGQFAELYDQSFPHPGFEGFLAESSSLMTSIIPKTFDFGGGHIAMDATCASVITALQIAWDAIHCGHNDAAVIVAMSPEAVPSRFVHYAQIGIFTRDAVMPFDENASGSALGEGIGVMLVRRLKDAEAAGDKIHGVIRGIGVSSDGVGSGFVAPKQDGQVRAMRAAYAMSGVDPKLIRMVEAHATGAPKGDITELESMREIFGSPEDCPDKIVTGSVKGNVGHMLEASGMASIFKVCSALKDGILPPTIYRTLRPELLDGSTRFELLSEPKPWPQNDVRRFAAASSFGFGGVNAHIILEAHPSTAKDLPLAQTTFSFSSPTEAPVTTDLITAPSTGSSIAASDYVMLSNAEVEAGVLEIIANCTGYEVGELQLDHDLDADLGVDSIKHMEVLLSVGEKFKVQAEEGDQITDYPTIGKLVELAQTRQNTSTGEPSGMMAELMAGLQSGDLPPEAAERLTQMGIAAPTVEVNTVDVPAVAAVVEAPKALETPVALVETVSAPVVPAPANDYVMLSNAEVEAGVLEIIANCTGYEVGELQLDHDLDADLGVDSIKHMEVLLSVGEKFKVQAEEGDQITDYPTIGKLVELAQTRQNTSTGEPSGMMAELMAGLQSGDLPPEAAERLTQMGIAAPTVEVTTVDVPAVAAVIEAPKVLEAKVELPIVKEAPKPVVAETLATPVVEASVPAPQLPVTNEVGNESLALVQKAVATLRNYEPHWVHPHLSLVGDLGLSETEMASIRQQLGLKSANIKDLTIQAMAQEIGGVPVSKLSEPAAVASPEPSASKSMEDWVLVVGKATTDAVGLAKAIHKALKISKNASLKVDMPSGTRSFALVVDRQASLETLQARLEQSGGKTSVLQSLWWGEVGAKSPGAMAWLFPGSGSLYAGFLEDLASIDPAAQRVVDTAKAEYKKLVNQELHFEPDTDPLRQRPATVTASAAMARTLQSFGLTPDFVAGHSVGELTACYLAGAIDLPELMRLTTAPFKGLSALPNGAMAAILGPEATTLQIVSKFAGRVVVSNRNSAQQLVVSGKEIDIVAFCEEAKALNLKPVRLEVQTAYHSPLLGDAHKQYREALQTAKFQMPKLPVISGLSGDQLPFSTIDPAQTRAMLDCAFIAPVNHVSQLRRLQEMGAKVYVDMGPTDRLSRLAKETLDPSATVLSANRTKRNGRLAFLETLAQLHVLGYEIKAELPVEAPAPVAVLAATAVRSSVVATVPAPTNGKMASPTNGNGNGHSKVTAQTAVATPVRPAQTASQPTPPLPNGNGKTAVTAKVSKPALDLLNHRPSLLEPIAVVGMGALMPDANNVEEFWQNLISGHDAIRELPQDLNVRWKLSTFYNADPRVPDKTYSKIGAFVPNFAFKPIEFKITPKTSIHMDRSQKMALLCTREAFKDSGYNERTFDRKRVRVIIGTSVPEWHDLAAPRLFFDTVAEAFQRSEVFALLPKETQTKILEQARDDINSGIPACCEDSMPGGLPNIVAGRVAFCFDIQGGNVIVDAACAASLAALDNAVKALRMGEIDMVIVGGSDSAMSAGSYVGFCKTFALSAKGSFPFDSRADGFVMGEGSGIMLLKRLGDAERDEDKIHAVIRGIGSSSDGRGRGITAPSIDGQVLAMERAYADAGVDPKTIGFMEAHGTSTPLGDSTEFASLVKFFGEEKLDRPIYVGSVKSMIGHLKTAAGVAGLMKAVLAVQRAQIPPTLHFETPNPKINLEKSPFTINTQTMVWEKTSARPLRAAVNSFGFGGTNFHVIVEAYDRDFYHSEAFENELRQTRCYQDFYANLPLVEGSEQIAETVAKTNGSAVHETPAKTNGQAVATPGRTNGSSAPVKPIEDLATALRDTARSLAVVGSQVVPGDASLANFMADGSLRGWVGALNPQDLGSESFRTEHGVKYNYVAGAMAAGIGSAEIVVDMAKAGMLGFFGSGGVPLEKVEKTIVDIKKRLVDHPKAAFGFNLLHNPIEAGVEDRTIDMYLEHGVTKVSASAYLRLMPTVVRYRAKGMMRRPDGSIFAPNSVFAKVSSLDVAGQFMAPPPLGVLKALVAAGKLTSEEAEIAAQLPVASDITAEADSGGHTDRRALPVLLPQMLRLRDEIAERHGYAQKGIALRIGAAGGIGDPISARAAFAFGADYILTGTINQTSPQSGTSDLAREMLTKATMSDVVMAPAADMFEMGVQVQILKRGSFYPQRAKKLYEIYKTFDSLATIAPEERVKLERDIFRQPLDEVWANTASYWEKRDPKQLEKALKDGKHQMALTFRAYLGLSSRWAQTGQVDRKSDYQIWCGPSMGSFNSWVAGTWLEPLENRDVAIMGKALMYGAAVLTRAARLAQFGIAVPSLSELSRPAAREFLLGL
ncbi:MAG: PfaD family polyunsaturated fatty acid/polyketide biosynthesis protein [Anaerolineae bacterium]|nr:PfaD family polyunsaturated fatty acid/polyketide biosynthesis protein [Gloeobacterales cyanobacterium ES-bin-313]